MQPAPRVLVAAEPPFLVGERDREREAFARAGGRERIEQRRLGGARVACSCLRVGEQRLHPRSPRALVGPIGQQPQRGGVEARSRRRRG